MSAIASVIAPTIRHDAARPFLIFGILLVLASTAAFAGTPDWLRLLARQPLPSFSASTRAVALLDETQTTVTQDGEIRTLRRYAYKILGSAGHDLGIASVVFDSETKLTKFRGWSIPATGGEFEVKERDALESAAFEGELYADTKIRALRIPAADTGSVIGWEYEKRRRPYSLQESWVFQQDVPVMRARFVLDLPAGWSQESRWFNAWPRQPQVTGNRWVWEVKDLAAIRIEPGMPSPRSVAGRMAINVVPSPDDRKVKSHGSWNDVALGYAQLIADRWLASAGLQQKVMELTAGVSDPGERIHTLASFARRDIRYVAIEIGIGGYQPHRAAEIFANRYGDCKDKVTLLGSMLREVGVESYFVLVNTHRGVVRRDFATLADFNHAIIAIRLPQRPSPARLDAVVVHPRLGTLLLFDPTSSTTAFGQIPAQLQQSSGLLVTENGGDLIDIPLAPAEANRFDTSAILALDSRGGLEGDVREARSGWNAAVMRARLVGLEPKERTKFFELGLAAHLNTVSITSYSIENLEDPEEDLVITYHLSAPHYAKAAGGLLLVRPRLIGRKAEALLDLEERMYSYEFEAPSLEHDKVVITIPPGWRLDELPEPQAVGNPALCYRSASHMEGDALHYEREYRVEKLLIPLEALKQLNDAFTRILADERSSAVFKARV